MRQRSEHELRGAVELGVRSKKGVLVAPLKCNRAKRVRRAWKRTERFDHDGRAGIHAGQQISGSNRRHSHDYHEGCHKYERAHFHLAELNRGDLTNV